MLELLECPAGQAEDDSSFLYEDSVVGAVAGEEAEPIEDDGAATLVVCARDANNRGESVSASGGGRRHYYALRFKSSRGHRGVAACADAAARAEEDMEGVGQGRRRRRHCRHEEASQLARQCVVRA